MKKSFIYILIGVICFFSFNIDVKAEYTPVCTYSKNSNNDNVISTITLEYDEKSSKKFQVKFERSIKKDGNFEESPEAIWQLSDSDNTGGSVIKGKANYTNTYLLLYDKIENKTCPTYATFPDRDDKFLCFYNDSAGNKWCSEKFNNYASNDSKQMIASKSVVQNNNSSQLSGKTCELSVPIRDVEGIYVDEQSFIKLKFTYGSNLVIEYNNNGKYEKLNSVADKFQLSSVLSNSGNVTKNKYVYLTNSNVGNTKAGVVVNSRAEFDKKFMNEWNTNGSCPNLSVGDKGQGDYYLLFGDAAEDCAENGCSNVDVNNIVNLKDWNYSWDNFINMSGNVENCQQLIGDGAIDLINDILNYVKILVPVLLIGLGLADFFKALVSSQEDGMKKAQGKFIKRLLVAAIIFLIPALVNLLMNSVNGVWSHINADACNVWK